MVGVLRGEDRAVRDSAEFGDVQHDFQRAGARARERDLFHGEPLTVRKQSDEVRRQHAAFRPRDFEPERDYGYLAASARGGGR